MCYIHKLESDKLAQSSASQWLQLVEDYQKVRLQYLLLTGSEPMLRPDFKEIYRDCRKLGLMVSVNSDATLSDDDTIICAQWETASWSSVVLNNEDSVNAILKRATKHYTVVIKLSTAS